MAHVPSPASPGAAIPHPKKPDSAYSSLPFAHWVTPLTNLISHPVAKKVYHYTINLPLTLISMLLKTAAFHIRYRTSATFRQEYEKQVLEEQKRRDEITLASPMHDQDKIVFHKAINTTVINIFREMVQERKASHRNVFVFTPNILASLSMIYAGAPSKLKAVMEKALHMGKLAGVDWHRHFRAWTTDLKERLQEKSLLSTTPQFDVGQAILLREGVSLTEHAQKNLEYYQPEQRMFKTESEAVTQGNRWVETKTEGKIKNLIENLPDFQLFLLMISYAIFKGTLQHPFNKSATSNETFYNSDGTRVTFQQMNQGNDQLKRAFDKSMEILELPFNGNTSLLVVKPALFWKEPQRSVEDLEQYMTVENLQTLLENFDERFKPSRGLSVGVPKFELHDKTDLMQELAHTELAKVVGATEFNGTLVDRSGVTTPQLVTETRFALNEKGVSIVGASYSPSGAQSCDPTFMIRGPFGLVVVDKKTKTILGIGQVIKMEGTPAPEQGRW